MVRGWVVCNGEKSLKLLSLHPTDIKELVREQGSNNVIVTAADRDMLQHCSPENRGRSLAVVGWAKRREALNETGRSSFIDLQSCLLPSWALRMSIPVFLL